MTSRWKWNSSEFVIGLFQAPGQNSWTLDSSSGPDVRRMSGCLATELREKRKRDGDNDDMDVCFVHGFLQIKTQLIIIPTVDI